MISPASIRQICLILFPHRPHDQRFGVVLVPLTFAALPKVILIIQQQLLQARPRYIHQPQLRLAGGGGGAAAFGDILSAAARRLHHLIVRARTLVHKTIAK